MEIKYDAEANEVKISIDDKSETILLDDLLDKLPRELVRDYQLINEIAKIRKRIVDQIGDFNMYIIKLLEHQAKVREQMQQLDPAKDGKEINILLKVSEAISKEKNTSRELRHGVKLLSNEEGRILAEIEKLEV